MLDIVVLNLLFIIAPILIYLFYIVYENTMGNKVNDLFFSFSLVTSLYLITKYKVYFNYDINVVNVILIICLLKNKKILSILVSMYFIIYMSMFENINIYLLIIEYVLILTSAFFINAKDNKRKIGIIMLAKLVFDIIISECIMYNALYSIFYIIIGFAIEKLIDKSEKIINIYGTVREIENEKNFRDTLFRITHEIKNPIAVCKGYLDMIDVNNSKQVNKYVPIIKEEIEKSLTLMTDFLNLTKLNVRLENMDVTLLLEDLTESFNELLLGKDIEFNYDIFDKSIYINGDYDRLMQVFINLLKNSMEAIEKGGMIELKSSIYKNRLKIIISDNGIGMDNKTINRVGEPFFTTKKNGTGLGTKLSYEIIEKHGGIIKYKSKKDVGTTATISLPIKKIA